METHFLVSHFLIIGVARQQKGTLLEVPAPLPIHASLWPTPLSLTPLCQPTRKSATGTKQQRGLSSPAAMPESEISVMQACIPGDELLTVTAWHSLTNKVEGFHLGWDSGGGRGRER